MSDEKCEEDNQQIYKSQHRAIPKPAYLNTNQKKHTQKSQT